METEAGRIYTEDRRIPCISEETDWCGVGIHTMDEQGYFKCKRASAARV
jgi:hypothetical protein